LVELPSPAPPSPEFPPQAKVRSRTPHFYLASIISKAVSDNQVELTIEVAERTSRRVVQTFTKIIVPLIPYYSSRPADHADTKRETLLEKYILIVEARENAAATKDERHSF